jgi:hypothetical protein
MPKTHAPQRRKRRAQLFAPPAEVLVQLGRYGEQAGSRYRWQWGRTCRPLQARYQIVSSVQERIALSRVTMGTQW